MNRLLLAGGLLAAAAVVGLLVWHRPAVAPVAPVEPAATAPAAPAAAAAPPATTHQEAATAKAPAAPAVAATSPSSAGAVAPPTGPAPASKMAPEAKVTPLTKQEKLDGVAPAVPSLEEKVARLRKEADEEERQGHADAAKEKRVAADRTEKRAGEIRAALAEGKLPPGFVNPSSTDKSKE